MVIGELEGRIGYIQKVVANTHLQRNDIQASWLMCERRRDSEILHWSLEGGNWLSMFDVVGSCWGQSESGWRNGVVRLRPRLYGAVRLFESSRSHAFSLLHLLSRKSEKARIDIAQAWFAALYSRGWLRR